MAVVVLPSAASGLETPITESSVDLWSCSIMWRSARYCSASNDAGASRLTRCSSSSPACSASSEAALRGGLKNDCGAWGSGASDGTVSGAAELGRDETVWGAAELGSFAGPDG